MSKNRYDVDEALSNVTRKDTLKMLYKYLKPHFMKIFVALVFLFIISVIELLPPYFTRIIIDIAYPNKDIKLAIIITIVLILSHITFMYLTKIKAKTIHVVGQSAIHDIRYDLFSHMQKLPFSYFDSRPLGKISVRIVNYINSISNLLSNGIIDILAGVFSLIVILVFMFMMDVQFTFICLSTFPIFMLIRTVLNKQHKKAWQKYSAKQSNLNAYIQENISGMKVTQSFAREEENAKIFASLCKENRKYWMMAKFIELTIPLCSNVLYVAATVAIYLSGASRIENGLQVGILIAFTSYISKFWAPISTITTYYNTIVNNFVYIDRICEMMNEPTVIHDKDGAVELPNIKGDVEFKNVTFKYEEDTPNILEDVSFKVESGMSIALVGPTGAGKSTIINLISRFYDIQGGNIYIDGYDIKDVTLRSLRSQMGIMLQDSFLFSGTIGDNIRYGKPNATDEEVIQAAKAVCAHDFIMSLPKGYDTEVTEKGKDLSAGQRQLIAFARTLLKDPAILILDEATSSIDTETELALQKGIEALMKDRTSFVIAHRLSTIKNSSKIMYIADKSIAESGTHDELLEKNGKYADLYHAQFKVLEKL